MLEKRSVMPALEVFHAGLGDAFRVSLPGFSPVMLVGPEANRFVLVTARDQLLWRNENDPVAQLLGHGMLVEDGHIHDDARELANPALHRRAIVSYVDKMVHHTDAILAAWTDGARLDMMIEMRKITLQVVMDTLFNVDFAPELERLWRPLLRLLQFISPGWWMFIPGIPQPGVAHARALFDAYLFQIIQARRRRPQGDDLLGLLVRAPGLTDSMIRDQVMTMIVAGHDTIAALLAWAVHMLALHTGVQARARAEVIGLLGESAPTISDLARLDFLGQVVDETLRLYPPAHLGNRRAAVDLEFQGFTIPRGARVGYSIYLSHRHPALWHSPHDFNPERFGQSHAPFAFVPFGGGLRTCIGMNYALVEAKVVLARILQQYVLISSSDRVREQMAVTLQPRTRGGGVFVTVRNRG